MSFIDIFIVHIFCLSGSMDLLSKVVSVVLLFVHKHTHADSQIPQRPDMHHGAELPLDADKDFILVVLAHGCFKSRVLLVCMENSL